MNLERYDEIVIVPARRWDEQSPEARAAVRGADLAICADGVVIKDRFGPAPSNQRGRGGRDEDLVARALAAGAQSVGKGHAAEARAHG